MFEAHFQTFTDDTDPGQGKKRITALRKYMRANKIDAFIVPRADQHQSEYVPPSDERLSWLTGFTGSAGMAIIMARRAAIFIDGRYTIQVREQVDTSVLTPVDVSKTSPAKWLSENLRAGDVAGYDPWLTTPDALKTYEAAAKKAGAKLIAIDKNPIDTIWLDRPSPPCTPVFLQPKHLAGVDAKTKLARLRAVLAPQDAMVLSDPHDIAWLFNIRGSDVAHTPLSLCFAIVPRKGKARLFAEPEKISNDIARVLRPHARLEKPNRLLFALRKRGRARDSLLFDRQTAPVKLVQVLEQAKGSAIVGADPVRAMKAVKNSAELRGARGAHLRDGVAVAQFLCWFDENASGGKLTEIDAVKALETYRRDSGKLLDVSFPTISGSNANGAIVHYRVTEKTNRKIAKGLFLLDSGAQYRDGTTDITRTMAVGKPTREMRDRFTRVLKGHIAIATAVFPKGTSGAQLDTLARLALWEAGLDYLHGTGHGVGAFLSVHEGPQNISKRASVALEPGMILSNEPGYYKEGAFGIRIENLVAVMKADIKGAENESFCFENLTLAPIDLRLIESSLLTRAELQWLDRYHKRVRKEIGPLVDAKTKRWLYQATKPVVRK